MDGRGFGKECLEIILLFDLLLQATLVIAGQPADDLIYFSFRSILAFSLLDVQGYTLANVIANMR